MLFVGVQSAAGTITIKQILNRTLIRQIYCLPTVTTNSQFKQFIEKQLIVYKKFNEYRCDYLFGYHLPHRCSDCDHCHSCIICGLCIEDKLLCRKVCTCM